MPYVYHLYTSLTFVQCQKKLSGGEEELLKKKKDDGEAARWE